jgi:hypothetical protein
MAATGGDVFMPFDTPVIEAKLARPRPRAAVIPRERLFAALDRLEGNELTVVSSGGVIAIYGSEGHDAVDAALANAVKKSVAHIDGMSADNLKEGLAEAQAGMGG